MDTLPSTQADSRLVSSATGRLAHVLFTFPAPCVGSQPAVVLDCLRAAPNHARLTLATHASASGLLVRMAEEAGRADARIVAADNEVALSLWTQDVAAAFEGEEPAPEDILALLDRRHDRAPRPQVRIPGGNRLVARDRILIGADSWDRECQRLVPGCPEIGNEVLRDLFRRTVDPRPVLVVGTRAPIRPGRADPAGAPRYAGIRGGASRQPVYHLDMFVTLAGPSAIARRGRVFVASARMGEALAGSLPFPAPVADGFDEIAAQLSQAGFEVRRLPIAWVEDDEARGGRRLVSWNNGWVECASTSRTAWVPRFAAARRHLAGGDEAAAAAWQDMGFAVKPFDGAWALAADGGGLNCVALVLKRGH